MGSVAEMLSERIVIEIDLELFSQLSSCGLDEAPFVLWFQ